MALLMSLTMGRGRGRRIAHCQAHKKGHRLPDKDKEIGMKEIRGKIHGVAGPTVSVKGMTGAVMNTVCLVGKHGLLGEIIRIKEGLVTLQVYEDTSGISVGEEGISYGITPRG